MEGISAKDIREKTGAPQYLIDYLLRCQRIPVLKKSPGRGFPTVYHPDAVQVVEEHLEKSGRGQ